MSNTESVTSYIRGNVSIAAIVFAECAPYAVSSIVETIGSKLLPLIPIFA